MGVMRSEATLLLLLTLMAVSRSPATVVAEVYKVGDAAAWTIGGVDYHQWASCRAFHVGDVLGKLARLCCLRVLFANRSRIFTVAKIGLGVRLELYSITA